jgi:hypothetical protein
MTYYEILVRVSYSTCQQFVDRGYSFAIFPINLFDKLFGDNVISLIRGHTNSVSFVEAAV